MVRLAVLTVLIATFASAACDADDGGGNALAMLGMPSSPDTRVQVGSNGTLQTSVPSPTYTLARKQDAFARLNEARLGAGAGLVAQSAALDNAATGHAAYLSVNGFDSAASPHYETAGLADFTGTDPFVRMVAAGYRYSYATEVIGEIGSSSPTTDCVGDLLNTIYHAALMLSRVTDAGIGFGSGATAGMCSISLATPLSRSAAQVPPSGAIVAYPYPGAVVSHGTFLVANENPRASRVLLPNATAGTPVLVSFRNKDYLGAGMMMPLVTIDQFSLTDARGLRVPSVILVDSTIAGTEVSVDIGLANGFAVLVPVAPLRPGRYTVNLRAEVSGGQPLARSSWSFDVAGL